MQKRCQNCRKKVSDDLFICPHCGAIFGQPALKIKPLPKVKKPKKQLEMPYIPWLGSVLLLVVVIALALVLPRFLKGPGLNMESTPSADMTTTAPMVTYHLQVVTSGRHPVKNTVVEVYLDSVLATICQTGEDGKTSFNLPQSDNYQIRLVGLPAKYDLNYRDTWFAFPQGQQELTITLVHKPVPYIVKVVNWAGEPLPGASVQFASFTDVVTLVTDETGCCTFEAIYQDSGYYVNFKYLPTGYGKESDIYYFDKGSNELVITLLPVEEMVPDGKVLYTVYVTDDYGQPVADTLIYSESGDFFEYYSGRTNQDGWFSFIGSKDQTFSIWIPSFVDYSDISFQFEEGSTELLITLDLDREAYTYTVYFVDQFLDPISGVEIACPSALGNEEMEFYISDENGMITFESPESDPTKVYFYVRAVPEGHSVPQTSDGPFCFPSFSRRTSIILAYTGEVNYAITLLDEHGAPIPGAQLRLQADDWIFDVQTDENGSCLLKLPTYLYFEVEVVSLPDQYAHLVFEKGFLGGNRKSIALTPENAYTTAPAQ